MPSFAPGSLVPSTKSPVPRPHFFFFSASLLLAEGVLGTERVVQQADSALNQFGHLGSRLHAENAMSQKGWENIDLARRVTKIAKIPDPLFPAGVDSPELPPCQRPANSAISPSAI